MVEVSVKGSEFGLLSVLMNWFLLFFSKSTRELARRKRRVNVLRMEKNGKNPQRDKFCCLFNKSIHI